MEIGDKRRKKISFSSQLASGDYYTQLDLEHGIIVINRVAKDGNIANEEVFIGPLSKFKGLVAISDVSKEIYGEILSMAELLSDALTKHE